MKATPRYGAVAIGARRARARRCTIPEKRMDCPECGAAVGPADQTCQQCGEPLSFAPAERGVACAVCGAEIGAYTETCPECGETGYPALRPRKGKGWKGSEPEGLPKT